jgi:hypothetical protein
METATVELPTTRWELSAPESFVLLDGPDANGDQAFKLAVFELVGTGLLRVIDVDKTGILSQKRKTSVLARGDGGQEPGHGPLGSVWRLVQRTPQVSVPDGSMGVPITDLLTAAHEQYGSLDGFVRDEVMPELERRELYAREAYRILWLFPSTRWRLTPSGQQARDELERLIALGDERFRGWVQDDPSRAMAYTTAVGAAWLLMPAYWPLGREVYGRGDAGWGGMFSDTDPGSLDSLTQSFAATAGNSSSFGSSDGLFGDGGLSFDGGGISGDAGGGGDGGGDGGGGGGGC